MKKLKVMRWTFISIYAIVLCIFFLFIYFMPKQYEQEEQTYIKDSEKLILAALQEKTVDSSKKQMDEAIKEYPMELVVVVDGEIFYNTTSLTTIKPIYLETYVNESAILVQKQGEVDSTLGSHVSYWYTLYRMPNEHGMVSSYYLTIAIFTFALLSIIFFFMAFIQFYFFKPMSTLKESLKKVSDNNFSEVKPDTDVINKEFKEFSSRVDNFSKNVLSNYTVQEKELANTKRIFEENLLYSRAIIHDLKTPVHELLLENEYELNKGGKQEILNFNIKQADAILNKLNNVLKSLNTDVSYYESRIETFDVVELVAKQVKKFSGSLRQKKLLIDIHQPEQLMVTSSRVSIELMVQNMLSNAIQYAVDESDITLDIEKVGALCQINCSNISEIENIERIQKKNQFFSTYSGSNSNYQYSSGSGLYFIEELAQLIGSEYQLELNDNVVNVKISLKDVPYEEVI